MPRRKQENQNTGNASGAHKGKKKKDRKPHEKEQEKQRPKSTPNQKQDNQAKMQKEIDRRVAAVLGVNEQGAKMQQFLTMHGVKLTLSPKVTAKGKLAMFIDGCEQRIPGKGILLERKTRLSAVELSQFRDFVARFSTFLFGTQEPTLKLPLKSAALTASTGIIIDVYNIGWSSELSALFNSLKGIFDEVQVHNGEFHLVVTFASNSTGEIYPICGVIDYDDNTPLSAFDSALIYDTKKILTPVLFGGNAGMQHSWKWHSQGQPDLVWTDTSSASTYVCYFKSYIYLAISNLGSNQYAVAWGDAWCRFRQLAVS